MPKKWILSIDNGLDGAICLLNTETGGVDFLEMSSFKAQNGMNALCMTVIQDRVLALLNKRGVWQGTPGKTRNKIISVLEMPIMNRMGQTSKKSVASTVASYMILTNICENLRNLWGIPHKVTDGKAWQQEFWTKKPGQNTKALAIKHAQNLFPDVSLIKPRPRCVKPFDGFADALLIAEFARRKNW